MKSETDEANSKSQEKRQSAVFILDTQRIKTFKQKVTEGPFYFV